MSSAAESPASATAANGPENKMKAPADGAFILNRGISSIVDDGGARREMSRRLPAVR